jgi:hypothetical protein
MSFRLGAIVGAAALAVIGGLAASAADSTVRGVIRITSEEIGRKHVDLGRPGRSAGDVDSVRYLLFNRRITDKPIGHAEVLCTSTGYRSRTCMATYLLPRGRLVVASVIASLLHAKLAVLGGTGIYDNARGTLTITPLETRPPATRLVFRLVG